MNCSKCNNPIPEARLKALPSATECVDCSGAQKYRGFTIVNHKTGNCVEVIKDLKLHKELVRLDHSKGRARTGYAGAN